MTEELYKTLKPCPFCGEKKVLSMIHVQGLGTDHVHCHKCGANGAYAVGAIDAAEIWNTRPIESQLRDEKEMLLKNATKEPPLLVRDDGSTVILSVHHLLEENEKLRAELEETNKGREK